MSAMPKIVYKIVLAADWNAALIAGYFAGSADDRRDGFIHLSAAHQVASTLQRHFKDYDDLLLIAVDADGWGEQLKWDVSRGGELFPHLYGHLPTSRAIWQRKLQRDNNGEFVLDKVWLAC